VADPLTIAIELSFYAGLVMALPFLVLFLAEFVLPALTQKDRRMRSSLHQAIRRRDPEAFSVAKNLEFLTLFGLVVLALNAAL
jgi:hypothetical protein